MHWKDRISSDLNKYAGSYYLKNGEFKVATIFNDLLVYGEKYVLDEYPISSADLKAIGELLADLLNQKYLIPSPWKRWQDGSYPADRSVVQVIDENGYKELIRASYRMTPDRHPEDGQPIFEMVIKELDADSMAGFLRLGNIKWWRELPDDNPEGD